jgi:hypothetical protein
MVLPVPPRSDEENHRVEAGGPGRHVRTILQRFTNFSGKIDHLLTLRHR